MLENRKNVRKIIAILIALIVILGVFISLGNWRTEKREINTMAVEEFGKVKSSGQIEVVGTTPIASLDLEERSNHSNV